MKTKILSITILAVACAQPISACDFCAVYTASEAEHQLGKGFYAGVTEQFTHFGTLQENGHKISNETGQYLNSSVSQVVAGYNFTDRFGLQFNLPIIHREFKRPEGFAMDRGTESGIGDVSLTGRFVILKKFEDGFSFTWSVLGGIKFPTGDPRRIKEEFSEVEIPDAPESGIHGHDLALGSGSFDGIVGTSLSARWKRLFLTAAMQYTIRSEGDFGYRYADDIMWSGGPGVFCALNNNYTIAVQLLVSGESKAKDTFQNEKADDTSINTVYLGPQFNFTWSDRLSAQLGLDLPASIDNTALQVVADYRIRAVLTWRF